MTENKKDVSMLDVTEATKDGDTTQTSTDGSLSHSFSQMNIDGPNELESHPQLARRKSTLIFSDDDDEIPPYSNHQEHGSGDLSNSCDDGVNSCSSSSWNNADNGNSNNNNDINNDNDKYSPPVINGEDRASPLLSGAHGIDAALRQQSTSQQQEQQQTSTSESKDEMVPVDITWQQGGEKVYVTGSFTGWRKMIGLVPVPGQPGLLHVKLQLPVGTHRFRFIVDNELRFSDYLPTATDQMGNFVNYLEVVQPPSTEKKLQPQPTDQQQKTAQGTKSDQSAGDRSPSVTEDKRINPVSARSRIALEIEKEPDEIGDGFTRFHEEMTSKMALEYTQDIPAVFTDPTVMEQYYLTLDQQQNNHQNMAWLTPPQLPPHLENVPLNSYTNSPADNNENNSGALPIPNHVVLNHLATSSIKHNTLCVASIVRYKRKYVTQILYAPLQ